MQLLEWKDTPAWIVEGCEGEIKKGFPLKFNGWSLADVEKRLQRDGNIDLIMTHVGLKGQALLKDKLKVMCGDSEKLVKEHLLTLSDIRAYIGFKIRLEQFKSKPTQTQIYLEELKKILKLSAKSTNQEVQKALDQALESSLRRYRDLIHERNKVFINAVKARTGRVAVVIGALHIEDLEKQLTKLKIPYIVFVPKGLDAAGGDPILALEKMLNINSQ